MLMNSVNVRLRSYGHAGSLIFNAVRTELQLTVWDVLMIVSLFILSKLIMTPLSIWKLFCRPKLLSCSILLSRSLALSSVFSSSTHFAAANAHCHLWPSNQHWLNTLAPDLRPVAAQIRCRFGNAKFSLSDIIFTDTDRHSAQKAYVCIYVDMNIYIYIYIYCITNSSTDQYSMHEYGYVLICFISHNFISHNSYNDLLPHQLIHA